LQERLDNADLWAALVEPVAQFPEYRGG